MLVYLRIQMLDNCRTYTAYNVLADSPSYIWRYTNYAEGKNFLRTHMHRGLMYGNGDSLSLGIL